MFECNVQMIKVVLRRSDRKVMLSTEVRTNTDEHQQMNMQYVTDTSRYLWKHLSASTPKSVPAAPAASVPDQPCFSTPSTTRNVSWGM